MAKVDGMLEVVGSVRTLHVSVDKYLRWKDAMHHYADGGHLRIVPLHNTGLFAHCSETSTKAGAHPYWCLTGWDYQIDNTVETRVESAKFEAACSVERADGIAFELFPRTTHNEHDTMVIECFSGDSLAVVHLALQDVERLRDFLVANIKPE